MEVFKEYILQNWILILILAAFVVILATSAFIDRRATRRMYFAVGSVFLLSILVFIEFHYEDDPNQRILRTVLMALRYSATPLIVAQVIFSLVRKEKVFVFLPAILLLVLDIKDS